MGPSTENPEAAKSLSRFYPALHEQSVEMHPQYIAPQIPPASSYMEEGVEGPFDDAQTVRYTDGRAISAATWPRSRLSDVQTPRDPLH